MSESEVRLLIGIAWNQGYNQGSMDGEPYPIDKEITKIIELVKKDK